MRKLTLHEYRRQQAAPSPPASSEGKRLKRKPATSDLSTTGRLSPVSSPPRSNTSLSFSPTFRLQRPEDDSEASLEHGLLSPSFISLPATSQSPSFHPAESPSTDEAENFYRSTTSRFRDFSKSFKPIKHLPRPSQISTRPANPSPLRSESSSSYLRPSIGGLTSSSTFSLSRFPQPPQAAYAEPSSERAQDQLPHRAASASAVESVHPGPTVTPTIVHTRGASFDVVNPHASLVVSDFETPADRDVDLIDYFTNNSSENLLLQENMVAPSEGGDREWVGSQGKQGPARAIYDDYSEAYDSIARNRRRSSRRPAPLVNLPLPPAPATLNPRTPPHARLESGELLASPSLRSTPSVVSAATSPSFMQRISRVLQRKKENSKSSGLASPEEGREMTCLPAQPTSIYQPRLLSGVNYSTPVLGADTEPEIEVSRDAARVSMSDGNLAQGCYDAESFYASTAGHRDSESMYPSSLFHRRSIPCGARSSETDYADGIDISSYLYEFGTSTRSSQRLSRPLPDQFFRHPNMDISGGQENSTIGSILNQYGDQNLSQASLTDLMNAVDDDPPGLDHTPGNSDHQLITRSSGLSQLDFGFNRGSNHSSTISSPRTPDQTSFLPNRLRPSRNHPGTPPTVPLPLGPPINLEAPRPFFVMPNLSVVSERFSSYGDTRNLLYPPSQQFSSNDLQPSDVANRSSNARSAVASSTALPSPRIQEPIQAQETGTKFVNPEKTRKPRPTSTHSDTALAVHHTRVPALKRSQTEIGRRSQRAIDRIVGAELELVGQNNTKNRLSGSFILVSNTSTPRDEGKLLTPLDITPRYNAVDTESGSPGETNEAEQNFPTASTDRPSSGIPKMWRKLSPVRASWSKDQSPGKESYADVDDEGDEHDWETVMDPSRPDMKREDTDFTIGEPFSLEGLDRSRDFPSQFGDQESENGRTNPPDAGSGQQTLQPSYDFRGGVGFPHYHALTAAPSTRNPWRQPSPLPAEHINPFSSSPPQMSLSPETGRAAFHSRGDGIFTPTGQRTAFDTDMGLLESLRLTPQQEQAFLSSGPCDSILIDNNHYLQSPLESKASAASHSPDHSGDSSNPAFPAVTTSSDFALKRDNSFEKLAFLGPRGNLTGTPEGTGMRDAGSSLADTSSPLMPWASTPLRPPFMSSPLTQSQLQSPPPSQFSPAQEPDRATSGHSSNPSETSAYSEDEAHRLSKQRLFQHRLQPSRDRRTSLLSPKLTGKRTSVRGQTGLREMRLASSHLSEKGSMVPSDHTRLSHFVPASECGTDAPLRPVYTNRPREFILPRSQVSPHILPYPRPASSVYTVHRRRKQRLSWLIFVMLMFFPPFLVLYGFGKFDWLIMSFSKGEIQHCGRYQKKVALWTGVVASLILPAVAIALLLMYHFGLFRA